MATNSLERLRIILGISEDNTVKITLINVYLEKAREDIEAFCRDTFIENVFDEEGILVSSTDVFPRQLKNVQEDLALYRYNKRFAEGKKAYSLADESVTFDDEIPEVQRLKLYRYVRVFPRTYEKLEVVTDVPL